MSKKDDPKKPEQKPKEIPNPAKEYNTTDFSEPPYKATEIIITPEQKKKK